MVATPLMRIASWGFRPMMSGNTNVAPNIATTCWAPSPAVRPHESRSSGATTSVGPRVFPSPYSFQPSAIEGLLHLAPPGWRGPRQPAHCTKPRPSTGARHGSLLTAADVLRWHLWCSVSDSPHLDDLQGQRQGEPQVGVRGERAE